MVSRKRLSFKMFLWIRFYFKRNEQIDFKYALPYVLTSKIFGHAYKFESSLVVSFGHI